MVTCNSSSVMPRVRFPAPAPIFITLVLTFLLCGSAGALNLSENVLYQFSDFPYYYNTSNAHSSITFHQPSDPVSSSSSNKHFWISGTGIDYTTGSSGLNMPVSSLDPLSPSFRFIHVSWSVLRDSSTFGLLQSVSGAILLRTTLGTTTVYQSFSGSTSSDGSADVSGALTNYATIYASNAQFFSDRVKFDAYIAINQDYYLTGLYFYFNRPSNISSSTAWRAFTENIAFEVSSSKLYPPNSGSGGSGGSVDLSGITSQITSLSSQMASGFLGVNNNIDTMETTIASSIADQTVDLTDAIDQAVQDSNDHFDDWDENLENAISSSQRQQLVQTDQAVSEMHQIESDQLDDTDDALSDVGLDSYSIPQDYISGFTEFGNILTVLFGALPFISPLIIFSCSLGLASVLVGRRSRSSGSGGDG